MEPGRSAEAFIAIVEDNEADVDLLRYALEECGVTVNLRVLPDGDEAIRFLDNVEAGVAPCPSLFVLDVNLPRVPGLRVLQRLRQVSVCRDIPVVVLSCSAAERDVQEAERLGANRYITKPSNLDEYVKVGREITGFLTSGNH